MRISPSAFLLVFSKRNADKTRSTLKGFTGKLKGKPILDLVGSVIDDYEYLWDNYYFSTTTL